MRRTMLVLAFVFVGCDSFAAPEGTEPLDPPEWYAAAYRQTEECAGRRGNYRAVRFWLLPGPIEEDGGIFGGRWVKPHDIYFAPPLHNYPWMVSHEMLHHILQTGGHPPIFEECEWPHRNPAGS